MNRSSPDQVSLTVKTLPADADPAATAIARRLVDNLRSVGIDAALTPMAESELLRSVLVNGEFDLYVTHVERPDDPDRLRSLLHSQFIEEPGWQNPFGFADIEFDELLDDQRRADDREPVVNRVQRELARSQPFTPLAVADEVRALRRDRVELAGPQLDRPLGYLSLAPAGDAGLAELRATLTDVRVTQNLNPLAVEFRGGGTVTGLLYDPLGRRADGRVRPWLADDWRWRREDGSLTARVSLREDVRWHDGSALDADDVAFTYRFLTDTSLDSRDRAVPAPRFRGRTSLVERVTVHDERTVSLSFGDTGTAVARRAFTVPVLPAHVWRERTGEGDLAGLSLYGGTTEALVTPNTDPVGSGPLRLANRSAGEGLTLERVDDHFAAPAFERMALDVVPSADAALELLAAGDADVTGSAVPPGTVRRAARSDALQVTAAPGRSLYHVGYNVRRPTLNNPWFRRAIARLLDETRLVSSTFQGFAAPAASPLAGTGWTAPSLRWEGADPSAPFFGSDGELDAVAAKEAFRAAGYNYDDQGNLLAR